MTTTSTALSTILTHAERQLTEAGVASARADAEQLAAHVLDVRRGQLRGNRELDDQQVRQLTHLIARRAERVPLQHLVGSTGFRYLELLTGPGAFVPRPETEVVAGWLIEALREHPAPLIVDLCAGPGTIALAIANELPRATVHAVESDLGALEWARRNADARAAGGDRPISLHLGDAGEALSGLDGTVDAVISNPPYVATRERENVDPEVRDHDPEIAVFAGEDGLDVVRLVESAAYRLLKPGGLVVVEHSDRQGASAPAVFADRWADVRDHRDLTGRDRFVTARRQPLEEGR